MTMIRNPAEWAKLIQSIADNTYTHIDLQLRSQGLTDDHMADLGPALQRNAHIEVVNLCYNKITIEGFKYLAPCALKSLVLDGNALGVANPDVFLDSRSMELCVCETGIDIRALEALNSNPYLLSLNVDEKVNNFNEAGIFHNTMDSPLKSINVHGLISAQFLTNISQMHLGKISFSSDKYRFTSEVAEILKQSMTVKIISCLDIDNDAAISLASKVERLEIYQGNAAANAMFDSGIGNLKSLKVNILSDETLRKFLDKNILLQLESRYTHNELDLIKEVKARVKENQETLVVQQKLIGVQPFVPAYEAMEKSIKAKPVKTFSELPMRYKFS